MGQNHKLWIRDLVNFLHIFDVTRTFGKILREQHPPVSSSFYYCRSVNAISFVIRQVNSVAYQLHVILHLQFIDDVCAASVSMRHYRCCGLPGTTAGQNCLLKIESQHGGNGATRKEAPESRTYQTEKQLPCVTSSRGTWK